MRQLVLPLKATPIFPTQTHACLSYSDTHTCPTQSHIPKCPTQSHTRMPHSKPCLATPLRHTHLLHSNTCPLSHSIPTPFKCGKQSRNYWKTTFFLKKKWKLVYCTVRSLKGCSRSPSGRRALFSMAWVWGMLVRVQQNVLTVKDRRKKRERERENCQHEFIDKFNSVVRNSYLSIF